jgi:hypothetical protein
MTAPARNESRDVTEGLAWMREAMEGPLDEHVVAGQLFRPRGAWGDDPRELRRLLFRMLGVGRGLHELERHMSAINFAAVTPTRLALFAGSGSRRAIRPAAQIAEWPRDAIRTSWNRRTVSAHRFAAGGGDHFTSSFSTAKIVVASLSVPGEAILELDFPDAKLTSRLRVALTEPR